MNISEITNFINITKNIDLDHVHGVLSIEGIEKKYFAPILHPLIDFIQEFCGDREIYYDVIEWAIAECSDLDWKHFAFSEKVDSDILQDILKFCTVDDELIDRGHYERSVNIYLYIKDRVPNDFFNGDNYDKNGRKWAKNE